MAHHTTNSRIAQWIKAYPVQADVGIQSTVIVGRCFSENLPEFVLFHLKIDHTVGNGQELRKRQCVEY